MTATICRCALVCLFTIGIALAMKFAGFVKTDLFSDLNYAGTYYGACLLSSFPFSTTPNSQNPTQSIRPIRFFRETRTGTLDNSGDDVETYFEFSFLSNYDRNSIRSQRFYAQYKNFLAGQMWSAFADPDAFPDTLEFVPEPGFYGLLAAGLGCIFLCVKRRQKAL